MGRELVPAEQGARQIGDGIRAEAGEHDDKQIVHPVFQHAQITKRGQQGRDQQRNEKNEPQPVQPLFLINAHQRQKQDGGEQEQPRLGVIEAGKLQIRKSDGDEYGQRPQRPVAQQARGPVQLIDRHGPQSGGHGGDNIGHRGKNQHHGGCQHERNACDKSFQKHAHTPPNRRLRRL